MSASGVKFTPETAIGESRRFLWLRPESRPLALVRMALEQLSPEEERAVWLYAEGATLSPKQRTLAETALQKIRRMLRLE